LLSLQRNLNYSSRGMASLKNLLHNVVLKLRFLVQEDGQDLVEYALLVALISLAATSGMHTLASSINGAFSSITGKMTIA
jgi:pilus assembly protein Flp/PilA